MRTELAKTTDLAAIAAVHAACFERQQRSKDWIACQLSAFPSKRVFKFVEGAQIVGYAIWSEKSGFRSQAVVELEQVGVTPDKRGAGIASVLITQSLAALKGAIAERGACIRAVMVTTRADNTAQCLYRKTLGAEIVATLPKLFGVADEVIMLAELRPRTT
jgi:ribosomal protein S18 acetylase RimI-like enzyme